MVLDDFQGSLPHSLLLRLFDRYPLPLQTKGSHTNMEATRLVLTSNYLPRTWYPNLYQKYPHCLGALHRRIDELIIARVEGPRNWEYYEDADAQDVLEHPLSLIHI